jgi:hypothetical protein
MYNSLLMSPNRRFPDFYEKIVPVILSLIILAGVILLIVILGVATGWFVQ